LYTADTRFYFYCSFKYRRPSTRGVQLYSIIYYTLIAVYTFSHTTHIRPSASVYISTRVYGESGDCNDFLHETRAHILLLSHRDTGASAAAKMHRPDKCIVHNIVLYCSYRYLHIYRTRAVSLQRPQIWTTPHCVAICSLEDFLRIFFHVHSVKSACTRVHVYMRFRTTRAVGNRELLISYIIIIIIRRRIRAARHNMCCSPRGI